MENKRDDTKQCKNFNRRNGGDFECESKTIKRHIRKIPDINMLVVAIADIGK